MRNRNGRRFSSELRISSELPTGRGPRLGKWLPVGLAAGMAAGCAGAYAGEAVPVPTRVSAPVPLSGPVPASFSQSAASSAAVNAAVPDGGADAEAVSYVLAPVMRDGALVALDVTITLRADADGETVLDWVPQWAGDNDLSRWARDIRVDGALSTEAAPHGGRIIHSEPGAALRMQYRIVSAYAEDPDVGNSEQTWPIVRPGWFYAVGEVLFAFPDNRADAPARFEWRGVPGFGFASDLEHATDGEGAPRSVNAVLETIAIGGRDLQVAEAIVDGSPVRVAHVGQFDFDTDAFNRLALQVVEAERAFWNDRTEGPFLITAVPLAPRPGTISYGGTGRGDAFATWVGRNSPLPGLVWLLAHEYFHSWNARRLGEPDEETEARDYWLSEGFTDFYARRLMLRTGLWTPEQFIESWNDALRAYAASPFRAATNAAVAQAFWTDEDAQEQPYQRGALLAALWDRRLRTASGGRETLDTVLRAQRDYARAADALPPLVPTFRRMMRDHGVDIAPDVARYLDAGAPVDLPADAFGPCVRVETMEQPVFERGWDVRATRAAGNVIKGLDHDSNAYRAGLRDGMHLLRRVSGRTGDSSVDYVVEVRDGDAVRTIGFRPEGSVRLRVQRIVPDAARMAATPDMCAASLAG